MNDFNRIKIEISDWLLIGGLMFAPMDSLRFVPKIGIAEMMLIIWSVIKLSNFIVSANLIVRFWTFFLMAILVGSFVGITVAPEESTAMPDFFIYVYFAIISFALSTNLPNFEMDYLNKIIKVAATASTLWYFGLFIIAKHGPGHFLGAIYWFGLKFTGGAENPNKLAVFMCEILFLNIYILLCRYKNDFIFRVVLILCSYYIGLQTQSSMFLVAVFGSATLSVYVLLLGKVESSKIKASIVLLTIVTLAIVVLIAGEKVYSIAYEWIASDSNGLKRFHLFASIGETLRKSAIFGLGPGMHALNGQWTYHNAYLEILAMSGFVGLSIFLIFIYIIIKECLMETDLLVLILPLLIYGTGSFAVRNIEFWVVICLVYAMCKIRHSYE